MSMQLSKAEETGTVGCGEDCDLRGKPLLSIIGDFLGIWYCLLESSWEC